MHKTATQKPKILRDGRPIAANSNVKYLGLWTDDNFNLDIHLKFVEHEITNAVGILNKLKCYFPKKTLLQLNHVLIYLHHLYAIPIWGSTCYDAIVALGMCKVCKCTGAPPLLGGPPFDLSRAEKFDYEKL